ARASASVHLDPASLAGLGAPLEQRAELVAGVRAAQDGRAARAVEHLDRAGDAGALLAAPLRFGLGLPLQGSRPRPAGGLALWAQVANSAGRPGDALPLAIEAAETPGASLWPDSPQAMGAALAVLAADSATALRLLTAPPPAGVPAVRHRLLAAWVHLRTGRYEPAVEALAQLRGDGWLPAREALLAACLATGLARRSGDIAALRAAWATAEPLLARRAADLWQLEPLEELAVAAARLRLEHRVVPVLGLLEDALAGGGRPAAWEAASGWLRLQCAVVREDVTGAADAADRIAAAARAGTDQIAQRRVDAQAAAARAWVAALAGDVDVERVLAACALLTDAELPWEASRLAGQAAIRTTDPSAARRLLERAREGVPAQHERTPTAGAPTVLSERELEVAELVRAGRTHREIGAQLYLSPKTVEHHVARIRSKLGASTRAEFLAALAAVLPDP
ncbi:MAG TPA: helix-turn-helix transcriptional regulator, partial [Kineosporiaceae bacterium]|nr:helix-turn-helix transcriptional regulator [Kineosporiaceae bacterium]